MTKQEIRDLIATKISGQGNQVDIGNALATVLNEVIDKMPESSPYELYTGIFILEEFPSSIDSESDFISVFGNKGKAFLDTIKTGKVPDISGFSTITEKVTTAYIALVQDGNDWKAYCAFGGTAVGELGGELSLYLHYEKASDSFVSVEFKYTEL